MKKKIIAFVLVFVSLFSVFIINSFKADASSNLGNLSEKYDIPDNDLVYNFYFIQGQAFNYDDVDKNLTIDNVDLCLFDVYLYDEEGFSYSFADVIGSFYTHEDSKILNFSKGQCVISIVEGMHEYDVVKVSFVFPKSIWFEIMYLQYNYYGYLSELYLEFDFDIDIFCERDAVSGTLEFYNNFCVYDENITGYSQWFSILDDAPGSFYLGEMELEIDDSDRFDSSLDYIYGFAQERYEQGFQDGEEKGFAEGGDAGYDLGYDSGFDHGYDLGFNRGFENGKNDVLNNLSDPNGPYIVHFNSIYDRAFEDGHRQGYDDGYVEGYDEGKDAGRGESIDDVYDEIYQSGYDDGHDVGYELGWDEGSVEGQQMGYDLGYSVGYGDGYAEEQFTMSNLFWTIGGLPFETFKQIWNVDFLGVNIANFITGLLLSLVALYIFKKIFFK